MPDLCKLDKHNKHKVNREEGEKGPRDSTQGTKKKKVKLDWNQFEKGNLFLTGFLAVNLSPATEQLMILSKLDHVAPP